MTTEDPRIPAAIALIEQSMDWIEQDPDVCGASWAHRTFEKLRNLLLVPTAPVAAPAAPELPHNDPSRVDEDGLYTPPPGFRVKCQHCDNDATHADSCPYQHDVHDDETLYHFWCDSRECKAIVRAAQDESADCI